MMAYETRSHSSNSSSSSSLITARESRSGEEEEEDGTDDNMARYDPGSNGFTRKLFSKRERIQNLKKRSKIKTKRFLHLGGDVVDDDNDYHEGGAANGQAHDDDVGWEEDHDDDPDPEPNLNLESDPGFDPDRLEEMANPGDDGIIKNNNIHNNKKNNKGLISLRKVVQTISHPRNAIKTATTKKTAGLLSFTAEHPHISQRSEYEFLLKEQQQHNSTNDDDSNVMDRSREDDDNDDDDDDDDDSKKKDFSDSIMMLTANNNDNDNHENYLERANKLEDHREKTRVAWITGAHLDRARVVRRDYMKKFPDDPSTFEEEIKNGDDEEKIVRFRWEKWIGYMLLYYTQDFTAQYIDDSNELPFDLGLLKSHLERFVMASAPWQAWCMHIRHVFRWEDPIETGRWLIIYCVVWYTQNMMAFVWGYIIYMVIRNRYHPSSLESLQESMNRNVERGSMAYRLGELINKHGREDWLGPLIDEAGPMVQLQLGDLANLLEVFSNFYAWKSPRKTLASIFLFSICLTVSLVADMKFCMKVFWFVAGCGFFGSWPISSRYPKYRLLVSPCKWLLWDIPTHAEWSFQYLRHKAQLRREEIIGQQKVRQGERVNQDVPNNGFIDSRQAKMSDDRSTTTSIAEDTLKSTSLAKIPCTYDHHSGELIILASGLAFTQTQLMPLRSKKMRRKELWQRSFLDLAEMRKLKPSNHKQHLLSKKEKLMTMKKQKAGITFFFTDGTILVVEMKDAKTRDQTFNLIIGYSGLRWM